VTKNQTSPQITSTTPKTSLAELRKSLKLSQTTIASRMGIVQSRVSAIERGDIANTQVDTIRAYTQALGVNVNVTVEVDGQLVAIG
jgi:transcriptional regulator with XRE-family HTH domain